MATTAARIHIGAPLLVFPIQTLGLVSGSWHNLALLKAVALRVSVGDTIANRSYTLTLKTPKPQVLSHRRTTLPIILTTLQRHRRYKSNKGWWYNWNLLHCTLSLTLTVPLTTWQSPMVTGQPCWRRPVDLPCRATSPAWPMSSTHCLEPMLMAQRVVGVSAGVPWHQVCDNSYLAPSTPSTSECLPFDDLLHKITSILFRIILSFSKQAQPWRFLHCPRSLGLHLS